MTWETIGTQALTAVVSGSMIAAILGLFFHRRTKAIEQQLRVQAEGQIVVSRSTREWQEASVSRVLGPAVMHLARTQRAFRRWKSQQLFLEMEIIGNSNRTVRDLLLANGHLLPSELLEPASALIEHYDAWLEEFEDKRRSEKPDLHTTFIFVGPKGFAFPSAAEDAFVAKFHELRAHLYGIAPQRVGSDSAARRVSQAEQPSGVIAHSQ